MSDDTEITRTIEVEGQTIHIHIHLTEEEIRRLLLPHIAGVASELQRWNYERGSSTTIRYDRVETLTNGERNW